MKIGIDLGTTNSLVAFVNDHNNPELIPDPLFSDIYIIPSVVHVTEGAAVIGEHLERLVKANPQLKAARSVKLIIGNQKPIFHSNNEAWTAEKISALILKKVKQNAEIKLGETIDEALIAIPANFDSNERVATQIAATMAGFKVTELVEEPVAAAASYCLNSNSRVQTLFVYDLGGGTFDATVIHVSEDGLYALSTIGSKEIGGKFFDDLIVKELKTLYFSLVGNKKLSTGAIDTFEKYALEIKQTLDPVKCNSLHKSLLIDGYVMDVIFTYQELSQLIYPLLDRSLALSEKCINDAGLNWDQIDTVILVGGSSLLPAVRNKLADLTSKDKDSIAIFQPQEAIAYGAAILGDELVSENGNKICLKQQIASTNLGIAIYNPKTSQMEMEVLIERNTPLPKTVHKTFYTNQKNQKELVIQLVQSKIGVDEFEKLGNFSIGPIENESENESVDITITLNKEAIIKCSASIKQRTISSIQQTILSETNQRSDGIDIDIFSTRKVY